MKNFFKNNLRFVLLVAIAICFAVISGFGVFNAKAPSTCFQAEPAQISLNQTASSTVCYKLTLPDGVETESVWINFADYDRVGAENETSKINVGVGFARSLSGSFFKESSSSSLAVSNTFEGIKPGEWQYLSAAVSYKDYTYVCVYTYNDVKINELAFVGKDANGARYLLEAESVGAGIKNKFNTSIAKSAEFDVTESGRVKADLLIDEQRSFSVDKINEKEYASSGRFAITEKEFQLIESVRNTLNGSGKYLDKTAPLGLYVSAIGTGIFGYNALGVRFVPYIFTIATIVLLYFIGTLLFKKADTALILSLLFALSGYSLFFATAGTVMPVFIFFTLLAFYSAVKFYKKGISSKYPAKGLSNILIGGVAFSIAVGVKAQAVFYAIPLLVVYAFGLIRQYNAYKSRKFAFEGDQAKTLLNKKDYKRKVFLTTAMLIISHFILAFIIICITYLVGKTAFGAYYGKGDLFAIIGANFKDGVKVVSSVSRWGYIFNYDAFMFSATKYLFANVIVCFVGVIAFLTTLIYTVAHLIEIKKKGLTEDVVKNLIMSFAFIAVFFVTGFVLPLLSVGAELDAGYMPIIFATLFIALLYNYYDGEDKKALFKVLGVEITISKIITAVIILSAIVVYALAIPTYLGISLNVSSYFGVINKGVFLG